MQVQILGNQALISSAFAEATPVGLQLGINIRERESSYHRVGGCAEFTSQYDGRAPEHQAIEVYPSDDTCDDVWAQRATVVFYAESPEDADALNGIVYDCYEKGQLLLLLVPRDKLTTTRSLCDLRVEG